LKDRVKFFIADFWLSLVSGFDNVVPI